MASPDLPPRPAHAVAGPTPAPAAGRWPGRALAALGTLKVRLTLAAMGALVVGIGVISMLSLGQVERDLLAQTQARELAQTARLAAELSQRVVALQQALRATAEQIAPALGGSDAALQQRLLAQPRLLQPFTGLFVADRDGQVRVAVDGQGARRQGVSIADRDYFQRTLREQRPLISEALADRVSGEPVIVLSHPIVRQGRVVAVVGGALHLSSRSLAASLLDDAAEADRAELLAIGDEAGQALAHPAPDRLLKPLASDPRLAEAVADWQGRGSPAEPTGLLLQQRDGIVTAAGSAGTPWVVWRAMPQAALLEPLRVARLEALRNAAVVVAVLGLLTLWLLSRLLAPLRQLEERAQHLFDADGPGGEGWPVGSGEVGSLVQVLRRVGSERAAMTALTDQLLVRLNTVMAAAPLGIAFTRHQRFELVNRTWCRLLQRDEAEIVGTPAADIYASAADYEALGAQVGEAFRRDGEYAGEWRFRRRDGTLFWGLLSGRPVDRRDAGAGTIWTLADVTASRASRETLEWLATHDSLTGLANRAAFDARLGRVLGHPPAALVLIDLDRFKPVNDRHGHGAGDAMLKQVAQALTAQVRAGDLVARLGGDEFGVVLERCGADAARRVAGAVQRAVEHVELAWEGATLRIGASVGVALLDGETATVRDWIAAADRACYAAKAAGRGTVRLAGPVPAVVQAA